MSSRFTINLEQGYSDGDSDQSGREVAPSPNERVATLQQRCDEDHPLNE